MILLRSFFPNRLGPRVVGPRSLLPSWGVFVFAALLGVVCWGCASAPSALTESLSPAAPEVSEAPPPVVPDSPFRTKLEAELDALFQGEAEFAPAFWGCRVETLDGRVLYDLNGSKLFVPASNLKVVTTAAALAILGPNFTYSTTLEALGEIDPFGVLHGHLLITGSGDPSLGSWHLNDNPEDDSRAVFHRWAAALRARGIHEVRGDIVGDGRVFTEEFFPGCWEIEDLPYWYAAGSSGLCIEENCFRFISAPGEAVGEPARLTLIPDTRYVTVVNKTRTAPPGSTSDIDIVYRHPEDNVVRFERSIALDREPFQQRGSIWDGERYTAFLFKEYLEREGIRVAGEPRNIRSLDDPLLIDAYPVSNRLLVATYVSPPLSNLAAIINKPSHNFFADQVLRTLGYRKGFSGNFQGGVKAVTDWMRSIDVPDMDHFRMLDGSGLARRNYVQPRQLAAVLRTLYNHETLRQPFVESLPVAGVDGGLRRRMLEPPLLANVYAKTGFIGNVRGLSGYVKNEKSETLVFAFLVNKNLAGTRRADRTMDAACRILAAHLEQEPK